MTPAPLLTLRTLALLAAATAVVGCNDQPKLTRLDVKVGLDKALTADGTPPSTTVHLVGLTAREVEVEALWPNYPVSKYMQPGDLHQREKRDAPDGSLLAEFNLGPGKTSGFLSKKDALWDRWKKAGVMYVAILSSYPRPDEEPQSAALDVRRKIVPLDSRAWRGPTLDVTISDAGVAYTPTPIPIPPK